MINYQRIHILYIVTTFTAQLFSRGISVATAYNVSLMNASCFFLYMKASAIWRIVNLGADAADAAVWIRKFFVI